MPSGTQQLVKEPIPICRYVVSTTSDCVHATWSKCLSRLLWQRIRESNSTRANPGYGRGVGSLAAVLRYVTVFCFLLAERDVSPDGISLAAVRCELCNLEGWKGGLR